MWLGSCVAVAVLLWRRLAATALNQALAWELPHAMSATLKKQKTKKKKKNCIKMYKLSHDFSPNVS